MRLRPFLEANQMQIEHIELFVTDPDGHWFQLVNPEVH